MPRPSESEKETFVHFSTFQKHSKYPIPLLSGLIVFTYSVSLLCQVMVILEMILVQNFLLSKTILRGKQTGSMCCNRSNCLDFLFTRWNWALLKAIWQAENKQFSFHQAHWSGFDLFFLFNLFIYSFGHKFQLWPVSKPTYFAL